METDSEQSGQAIDLSGRSPHLSAAGPDPMKLHATALRRRARSDGRITRHGREEPNGQRASGDLGLIGPGVAEP